MLSLGSLGSVPLPTGNLIETFDFSSRQIGAWNGTYSGSAVDAIVSSQGMPFRGVMRSKQASVVSTRFPVTAGETLYGGCFLGGGAFATYFRVDWIDSSGAFSGGVNLKSLPAGVAISSTYFTSSTTVPSGVAYARPRLLTSGATNAEYSSYSLLAHPYIGRVAPTMSPVLPGDDTTISCCLLIELQFDSAMGGTQRMTNFPIDLPTGGYTWTGLGNVIGIDDITSSIEAGTEQLTLSLSASSAMLAATIGNVEAYRGRAAKIYLQFLYPNTTVPMLNPILIFPGYMNPVKTEFSGEDSDTGIVGAIKLPLSRSGMARSRNATGIRLTNVQQQLRYSGDTGLEYMRDLIENPTIWLSKAFQKDKSSR
jgi:hypothetical protein